MKHFLLPIFALIFLSSSAQDFSKVNTNEFITECVKQGGETPHSQAVIWFPYEYWILVGEKFNFSSELVKQITDEMNQYMMFAVVDYTISNTQPTFKSEDEIRKSIKLYDSSGNIYLPVNENDLSPLASQVLEKIKPVMSQMLGQFGDGMRLFLFDARLVDGKPPYNVAKSNHFTLSWDQTNLKWILPFASILPPKYCPVDNEKMQGNWNYCPVHGVKLDK